MTASIESLSASRSLFATLLQFELTEPFHDYRPQLGNFPFKVIKRRILYRSSLKDSHLDPHYTRLGPIQPTPSLAAASLRVRIV
jgi:hypothetical protein